MNETSDELGDPNRPYPHVKALSDRVKKQFIINFDLQSKYISQAEDLMRDLPVNFQQPLESFLAAMRAISDAACLPQRLVFSQTLRHEWSSAFLHALHSINNQSYKFQKNQESAEAEIVAEAHARAEEKMYLISRSEEGINRINETCLKALLIDHRGNSTEQAARELRYQTAVALWSALEVLLKDQLIQILNYYPSMVKRITGDDVAKKRFEFPKITYDELEERGFDFRGCMGDILIKQRDVSDLLTLKAAVGAIFGKGDLYKRLDAPEIRLLNLQRHLIVHRRGIVDKRYLAQSGESLSEGDRIAVLPSSIVNYFRAVAHVGAIACSAFSDLAKSVSPHENI